MPRKGYKDHEKSGKCDIVKGNKMSIGDPKEKEIYELSDEEYRIILLKKLSKIWGYKQLNKIRKSMDE